MNSTLTQLNLNSIFIDTEFTCKLLCTTLTTPTILTTTTPTTTITDKKVTGNSTAYSCANKANFNLQPVGALTIRTLTLLTLVHTMLQKAMVFATTASFTPWEKNVKVVALITTRTQWWPIPIWRFQQESSVKVCLNCLLNYVCWSWS